MTEGIEERQPLDSKHITINNKENIEKTLMLMIKDLEEKMKMLNLKILDGQSKEFMLYIYILLPINQLEVQVGYQLQINIVIQNVG